MSDALSLPELGVQGRLGSALAGAGDAAAHGAERAAGAACFASLVGLWLKNCICLRKKNSKEKKEEVWCEEEICCFCFSVRASQREAWLGGRAWEGSGAAG